MSIAAAVHALSDRFARAHPGDFHLALFGAGQCGRLVADALAPEGIRPVVVFDNDAKQWGKRIQGAPVLPPESVPAFRQHPFVVCVRDPQAAAAVHAQLATYGIQAADSCAWMIPPPGEAADLGRAFADEESRQEYLAQLRFRLGEPVTRPGLPHETMYFPELFQFHDQETFADIGAYDGDTFPEYRKRVGDFAGYHAFEPDPRNFARLQRRIAQLDQPEKIHAWNLALGEHPGHLRFRASGDVSSRVCGDGNCAVRCARLDDLALDPLPTYMKLDVEGSELSVLKSGEHSIRSRPPILAVCLYHRPQDLWEIPGWIAGLTLGYRVYLRRHGPADTELVCYAVPPGR